MKDVESVLLGAIIPEAPVCLGSPTSPISPTRLVLSAIVHPSIQPSPKIRRDSTEQTQIYIVKIFSLKTRIRV